VGQSRGAGGMSLAAQSLASTVGAAQGGYGPAGGMAAKRTLHPNPRGGISRVLRSVRTSPGWTRMLVSRDKEGTGLARFTDVP
jgi:hypothetical protein